MSLANANYSGTWEYVPGEWGEGAVKQTVAVKTYAPNRWGLHQMHGNVWEWCQGFFGEYQVELGKDPLQMDMGSKRVFRGGSWYANGRGCRSAYRGIDDSVHYTDGIGFRLARDH